MKGLKRNIGDEVKGLFWEFCSAFECIRSVCLWVRVCMCEGTHAEVHMHMHVVDSRLMSGVSLNHSPLK